MSLAMFSAPISFATPKIGAALIEIAFAPFRDWLRAGFKAGRWPTGEALTRDLIAEQTLMSPDKTPLDPSLATNLDDAELHAFADAVLDAAGPRLAPSLIGETTLGQRKVRHRDAGEAYDLSPRAGEDAAARLLRVFSDWNDDQADHRLLTRQLVVDQISNSPGAKLLEAIRLSPRTKLFDAQRYALASLPGASLRSGGILAAAAKPQIFETLNTLNGQLTAARGLSLELDKAGWRKAIVQLPQYPSLQAVLGSDVLRRHSALTDVTKTLREKFGASVYGQLVLPKILTDRSAFLGAANRQFGLGLSAAALAAMVAATPAGSPVGETLPFPPGYQVAASLGLQGLVAPGVVSDVLQFYGETPDEGAELFADALQAAHALDEGLGVDQTQALVESIWARLAVYLRGENDPLRIQAVAAIIAFILAILTAGIAYENLQVAKAGATSADIIALNTTTKTVHADLAAMRADKVQAHQRLRFVHARANLRVEPDAHGQVIRLVYPDQSVRVIDERGDWAQVEVFDYHMSGTVRGWISRRLLKHSPMS